jgi:pimeloyl-ACP methyl ester carboxylesterase
MEETVMARLDRDGVAIHYEDHGQGPAILLSHGYSATCRMWDGQIAALKDRWRVIVWDMRGHGESNIIAERVLGLPQDVRVDKDVPFREVPTGRRG